MKLWVDPPEGWRYGFPKVWDSIQDANMRTWLEQSGYPKEVMKGYGKWFAVRQWAFVEQDNATEQS